MHTSARYKNRRVTSSVFTEAIPLVDYTVGWMDIPMIKRHWFINVHKDRKRERGRKRKKNKEPTLENALKCYSFSSESFLFVLLLLPLPRSKRDRQIRNQFVCMVPGAFYFHFAFSSFETILMALALRSEALFFKNESSILCFFPLHSRFISFFKYFEVNR